MPTRDEILSDATDEAKKHARDLLVIVGEWIRTKVEPQPTIDAVPYPEGASDIDKLLQDTDALNAGLDAKIKAKEEGEKIAKAFLASVLKTATRLGVSALGLV